MWNWSWIGGFLPDSYLGLSLTMRLGFEFEVCTDLVTWTGDWT